MGCLRKVNRHSRNLTSLAWHRNHVVWFSCVRELSMWKMIFWYFCVSRTWTWWFLSKGSMEIGCVRRKQEKFHVSLELGINDETICPCDTGTNKRLRIIIGEQQSYPALQIKICVCRTNESMKLKLMLTRTSDFLSLHLCARTWNFPGSLGHFEAMKNMNFKVKLIPPPPSIHLSEMWIGKLRYSTWFSNFVPPIEEKMYFHMFANL